MTASPARPARQFVWTVLVVAFIARLTLVSVIKYPGGAPLSFFCILGCNNESLRDLLLNIILFIPAGWVARYWLGPRAAFIACLLATIGIESTQAFILTGRDPSLRDILTNSGGGMIGIWLFDHWKGLIFPGREQSVRLGLIAFAGWMMILLATGIGTQVAPSARPWWGQYAADLGIYEQYSGKVLSVRVGGWTPPGARMEDSNPLRSGIEQQNLVITTVAVSAARPRRAAPMFSVFDDRQREQLLVGQHRRDLEFHLRTRFDDWELRGIAIRLPFFPGNGPGDTVTARASITPGYWHLSATSGDQEQRVTVPLTMGLGWNTMVPAQLVIYNDWIVLNALWLALLIGPVAFWFTRSGHRGAALSAMLAVAAVLALVPGLIGTAPTQRPEWIGTAAGIAIGALIALRIRRTHPLVT